MARSLSQTFFLILTAYLTLTIFVHGVIGQPGSEQEPDELLEETCEEIHAYVNPEVVDCQRDLKAKIPKKKRTTYESLCSSVLSITLDKVKNVTTSLKKALGGDGFGVSDCLRIYTYATEDIKISKQTFDHPINQTYYMKYQTAYIKMTNAVQAMPDCNTVWEDFKVTVERPDSNSEVDYNAYARIALGIVKMVRGAYLL